jgi:uncharacterized delta-60 repeat protein
MSRANSPPRAEALEDRLAPSAGDLDPTFGVGGKLTAPLQGVTNPVNQVAFLPDGRYLVSGDTTNVDFAATRLNADGSTDATFGTRGSSTVAVTPASDFVDGQAIQSDGKIVLVGSGFFNPSPSGIAGAVVRLTPDGQPDPTISFNGTTSVFVTGRQAVLTAVAVQPDGGIVVAGLASDPTTGQEVAVVARLTSGGQPDPAFGTDGVTTFQVGPNTELHGVVLQPDGRIVVVGTTEPTPGGGSDLVGPDPASGGDLLVARLTSGGQLDPAFGTGGTVTVDFGGADTGRVIKLQPDGKIVIGGTTANDFDAARLNPNGSLDATFGAGGKATLDFGRTAALNAVVLEPDGMVVLAGTAGTTATGSDMAVARLTADGLPDTSFGNGGRVTVDFGRDDVGRAVTIDAEGRIVVAGGTGPPGVGSSNPVQGTFAVARLLGDSRPPVLVGGKPDGTAVVLTPVGGTYQPTGTVNFFPGVPIDIRTATADVNGDGIPDLIGGAGPGAQPGVMVLDGKTGRFFASPLAFEPSFTGGVFVAAADLDGDGRAEVIATPDQGGGPNVVIFSFNPDGTIASTKSFFALGNPAFRGGARVAVGDVNGDGVPDVAVGAGFLGGPNVEIHDGKALAAGDYSTLIGSGFFAFDGPDATTLRNGVFLAAGDVNGDGFADLIAGGGPGGGPRVLILDGKKLSAGDVAGAYAAPVANFFFGSDASRGGVRVATTNADGDKKADLVVGSGEGLPSQVRVYLGKDFTGSGEPSASQDLDPFGAALPGGVFVG